MRYFWLNFHVNYACRHSGACCSAGWPIPVERDRVPLIQQVANHADWLAPAVGAPDDVAGALALQRNGHCVFHGASGCEIYSARPSSCSHFPYVCLIDQRGVHVTLSHYCPTAAAMLFDHDGPIAIVEGPAPAKGLDIPEGLDARAAVPSSHAAWPQAPQHYEDIRQQLVAPAWPAFEPVIARYLAAKAFASWAAYLDDDGTAAVLRGVETARAVLHVEAARQCALADRILDATLLKEAIRQSDLLLVHHAVAAQLHAP